MTALDCFPIIRKYIHHQRWANEFLNQQLSGRGHTDELTYPVLYLASIREGMACIPHGFMAKIESGLSFLITRAPKANRTDLIGNLQKANSLAAVFEVLLVRVLINEFGLDSVEPYPRIAAGSKRTLDFALTVQGGQLFFEATALFDDTSNRAATMYDIREGVACRLEGASEDDGLLRLERTCKAKANQRCVPGPLVLCLNQFCRDPEYADQPMENLRQWANGEPGCRMAGVAYFQWNRFVMSAWADRVTSHFGLSPDTINRVERALRSL